MLKDLEFLTPSYIVIQFDTDHGYVEQNIRHHKLFVTLVAEKNESIEFAWSEISEKSEVRDELSVDDVPISAYGTI